MTLLHRIEHDNGIVTYRSPLLHDRGIVHGFSTRHGGVSPAPFDSLNLVSVTAGSFADDPRNVAENFRRLRRALRIEHAVRVQVKQVHGCGVHHATADPVKPQEAPQADAIITVDPAAMLTIRMADCVPVLISGGDGRVVAAVHAGWRGIVAGIVPQTIAQMHDRHGIAARDLLAAIGPCISVAHFEVGPEVAAAFTDAGLAACIEPLGAARPSPHIDLPAAVHAQLQAAGVNAHHIDTTVRCTFRDGADFYSHRRDNGVTGRLAAVICPRT